jgi:hypothetical protein
MTWVGLDLSKPDKDWNRSVSYGDFVAVTLEPEEATSKLPLILAKRLVVVHLPTHPDPEYEALRVQLKDSMHRLSATHRLDFLYHLDNVSGFPTDMEFYVRRDLSEIQ